MVGVDVGWLRMKSAAVSLLMKKEPSGSTVSFFFDWEVRVSGKL
jgi:hypothetical protein